MHYTTSYGSRNLACISHGSYIVTLHRCIYSRPALNKKRCGRRVPTWYAAVRPVAERLRLRQQTRSNGGLGLVKPPPPVGAGRGYMFSGRPCVRACVRDSRGSFMFPRYLQYLLTDFRQTFVTGASWDTDDLITFFGSKGQSSRS